MLCCARLWSLLCRAASCFDVIRCGVVWCGWDRDGLCCWRPFLTTGHLWRRDNNNRQTTAVVVLARVTAARANVVLGCCAADLRCGWVLLTYAGLPSKTQQVARWQASKRNVAATGNIRQLNIRVTRRLVHLRWYPNQTVAA